MKIGLNHSHDQWFDTVIDDIARSFTMIAQSVKLQITRNENFSLQIHWQWQSSDCHICIDITKQLMAYVHDVQLQGCPWSWCIVNPFGKPEFETSNVLLYICLDPDTMIYSGSGCTHVWCLFICNELWRGALASIIEVMSAVWPWHCMLTACHSSMRSRKLVILNILVDF